ARRRCAAERHRRRDDGVPDDGGRRDCRPERPLLVHVPIVTLRAILWLSTWRSRRRGRKVGGMRRREHARARALPLVAVALALAWAAAACSSRHGPRPADKAGGAAGPVVLRLAAADARTQQPESGLVAYFARQVAQ